MVRFSSASVTLSSLLLAAGAVASFTTPSVYNHQRQRDYDSSHSNGKTTNRQFSSTTTTGLEMASASSGRALVKAASIAAGAAVAGTIFVKGYLDKPSRTYEEGSVAREYDAWADDGILEYYWGEHIHLGYYGEAEMAKGYKKKDFVRAKCDFIDEMMKFGGIGPKTDARAKVLDVGCGFGGTSRYLAKQLGPKASVTGITLSPRQVERGTELAQEQGIPNAKFQVTNALNMSFADNTFDIVWACESGEHMPDKEQYINEMMRVLKPGGKFVMATWCQRDDSVVPFSKKDLRDLQYLYEEWSHPHFISIQEYERLLERTKVMENIQTADWCEPTIASWRHSIWVGVYDPRGWIFKPRTYMKCLRDAYCLERMHRAFKRGLMEYGMFAATKQPLPVEKVQAVAEEVLDKVGNVSIDVQKAVETNVGEGVETAKEKAEDAVEDMNALAEDVAEKVAEKAEEAKEAIQENVEKIEAKTEEMVEIVEEKAKEAKEAVEEQVEAKKKDVDDVKESIKAQMED